MQRSIFAAVSLFVFLGAAQAQPSCVYPQAPRSIPIGAIATHEEIVEAHKQVKQFDEDIRTYNICLELELKALEENTEIDEERKDQQRLMLARKSNAAIDEVQMVVNRFNEQLRAYRKRTGK